MITLEELYDRMQEIEALEYLLEESGRDTTVSDDANYEAMEKARENLEDVRRSYIDDL